jgi:hypothetical protein
MTPASLLIRLSRTLRQALVLLAVLAAVGVPLAYAQDATTTDGTTISSESTTTSGTTTGTSTDGTTTEEEPPPLPASVAEGVTIAGVAVGGMTAEQVRATLRAFFARHLRVKFHHRVRDPRPARLGATPHVRQAVVEALAAAPAQAVRLRVSIDLGMLRRYVAGLVRAWSRPAVDSTVRLRLLRPVVTRAHRGYRIRPRATRRLVRHALRTHERGPVRAAFRVLRPRVTQRNFGPVVVVRRGSHRLYLYKSMRYRASFSVAVGMPQYPTPLGRFYIAVKQRNPWWYPPSSSWAAGASPIPPGPGNPLGTRWMGLSWGGIGIHGTPDSASIGYSASHGCIRMRISEAEWLFERVRIGTPVFIVSA